MNDLKFTLPLCQPKIVNNSIITLNFAGYQIHVKGNGSAFHSNITLNATTTNFVLTNLSLNEEYSVRAVAFTTIGLGPFSPPSHFLMDPAYLKFTVVPTGIRFIFLQCLYVFLTEFYQYIFLFFFSDLIFYRNLDYQKLLTTLH